MPELSRFFGIVITMYARDHEPAHFHARYGEDEVLIEIDTSRVLRGVLPRRALAMVEEWCGLRRPELRSRMGLARPRHESRTRSPRSNNRSPSGDVRRAARCLVLSALLGHATETMTRR